MMAVFGAFDDGAGFADGRVADSLCLEAILTRERVQEQKLMSKWNRLFGETNTAFKLGPLLRQQDRAFPTSDNRRRKAREPK